MAPVLCLCLLLLNSPLENRMGQDQPSVQCLIVIAVAAAVALAAQTRGLECCCCPVYLLLLSVRSLVSYRCLSLPVSTSACLPACHCLVPCHCPATVCLSPSSSSLQSPSWPFHLPLQVIIMERLFMSCMTSDDFSLPTHSLTHSLPVDAQEAKKA